MGEVPLNPTDRAALDMLREGRCTPAYIAEEHDYASQNVQNRLTRLEEHGIVKRVHTGLYELVEDPRQENKKQ